MHVEVSLAVVRPSVLEMLERCRVLGPVLDAKNVFVGVHDAVLAAERALFASDDSGGRDSPGSSLLLDSGVPAQSSGASSGPLVSASTATRDADGDAVHVVAVGGAGVGASSDGRDRDAKLPATSAAALAGQPCLIDLSETDSDMAPPAARTNEFGPSAGTSSVVSKSH